MFRYFIQSRTSSVSNSALCLSYRISCRRTLTSNVPKESVNLKTNKKSNTANVIEQIIQKHAGPNASSAFKDPNLKFKIVTEASEQVGRPVTSFEISGIQSPQDLVQLMSKPSFAEIRYLQHESVAQRLNRMELPPNMAWIPSQSTLNFLRKEKKPVAEVPELEELEVEEVQIKDTK